MIPTIIRPYLTCLFILCGVAVSVAQKIPFELDPDSNSTFTYQELTDYYKALTKNRDDVRIFEYGMTDVGKPLDLIVVSKDGVFDPVEIKKSGKAVVFINNGIHPGEPEGIDASMMFLRDVLIEQTLPEDLVLCIVPIYNIAGMLNRGTSRANQNGPKAYGFRGSRQHYDLNRDFIKGDTRNSQVFQKMFVTWDPDVFLDTHTSNGADYQYVMTLIETHRDKLAPKLSSFMHAAFTLPLYERMESAGYPMVPYVNTLGSTPETGLVSFLETPRYSSGFAALHHTIGYIPETHMWKSYRERVWSTYALIEYLVTLTDENRTQLLQVRKETKEIAQQQTEFPVRWTLDTTRVDSIEFHGFRSGTKPSRISGKDRLFYDRSKPFTQNIPYYAHYIPEVTIRKPKAYIVPQAYDRLIDLMTRNGVQMRALQADTVLEVEMYRIVSYQSGRSAYEGHFPHSNVEVETQHKAFPFYKGDWVIDTNQPAIRYIVETLEPQATDSFFNWNFFDGILSQKEYFSPYIFEEEAGQLLREDPELRRTFEQEKRERKELYQDGRAQLDWIYKNSRYYEDTHLLYPVGRQF